MGATPRWIAPHTPQLDEDEPGIGATTLDRLHDGGKDQLCNACAAFHHERGRTEIYKNYMDFPAVVGIDRAG